MNDTHPHTPITLTPSIPASQLTNRIEYEPTTEAITKYYSEHFEVSSRLTLGVASG